MLPFPTHYRSISMADVHSPSQRSYNMSRIRGKNTRPELLVRSCLHQNGFRFRLHVSQLPGKPDIVLPRYKTVVLVHGCFWHGHEGCRYFRLPQTRTEFWSEKIARNQANDSKALHQLEAQGWAVIVIWECELKRDKLDETWRRLILVYGSVEVTCEQSWFKIN